MIRALLAAALVLIPATLALAIEPQDRLFATSAVTLTDDEGKSISLFSGQNGYVEKVEGDKLLLRNREGRGWGKTADFLPRNDARELFTKAIDQNARDTRSLIARANVQLFDDQPKLAIVDTTAALKQDDTLEWAYLIRSVAHQMLKDYPAALADADKAIKLAPENSRGHNSRAWLLATANIDNFRNAAAAKESARKACALTGWKNRPCLDTLAAAHAEAGEFQEAIKWQTQIVESAPEAFKSHYRERLELYQSGKPCRE